MERYAGCVSAAVVMSSGLGAACAQTPDRFTATTMADLLQPQGMEETKALQMLFYRLREV